MGALTALLTSPEWARLLLVGVLALYLSWISKMYGVRGAVYPTMVLSILALRELLYRTVSPWHLLVASEALIILLYVLWLTTYHRERWILIAAYPATVGTIIFAAAAYATAGATAIGFKIAATLCLLLHGGLLFAAALYVTKYNSDDGEIIALNRGRFASYPAFFILALLIFPEEGVFFRAVVLPLLLTYHAAFIRLPHRSGRARLERERQFTRRYLDSTFDFMRTIGTAMRERIEVDSVLEYVVASLVDSTSADAGVIYLREAEEDLLSLRSERGHFPPPYHVSPSVRAKVGGVDQYLRATPIAVGEGVFGEAVEQNREIRLEDASEDPRFLELMEDRASTIASIYAVPIQVGREVRGLLSIATTTPKKQLGKQDWDRIKVFGNYCSLMLESLFNYLQLLEKQEIEQEVEIAAGIQRGLLPRETPTVPGVEVSSYTAAARGVSGDYYDLDREEDGRLFGLVCDVAGKGIPASLIMVILRTIVHMERRGNYRLRELLGSINRAIAADVAAERFATACVFTYEPESGSFTFANGGHHPALLYRRREERFEELDTPGIPVGIEKEMEYEETTTHLAPGDLVLLYTDGIVEAENSAGYQFGDERLRELLASNPDAGAQEIVASIVAGVSRFAAGVPQHDDQTLIALKVSRDHSVSS